MSVCVCVCIFCEMEHVSSANYAPSVNTCSSWRVYSTGWTFRGAEHPCSVRPPVCGFVWDPAQIMSVGLWTNLTACGEWESSEKWRLSWQAVRLPASSRDWEMPPELPDIMWSLSEGFESWCDRITAKEGFPFSAFRRIPTHPVASR